MEIFVKSYPSSGVEGILIANNCPGLLSDDL